MFGLCECCGKYGFGDTYEFYYGSAQKEKSSITAYDICTIGSAVLCDDCIDREYGKKTVSTLSSKRVFGKTRNTVSDYVRRKLDKRSWYLSYQGKEVKMCCSIFWTILYHITTTEEKKPRKTRYSDVEYKETGSKLAIKAKQSNYPIGTLFFTPKERNQLKKYEKEPL